MANPPGRPWLDVPLADYEGHMSAPAVDQLVPLADLFAVALRHAGPPGSVAILGIAGGNGLDRINPAVTRRIAGLDLHPEYLAAVAQRFGHLAGLELHQADLASEGPLPAACAPADLVHCALIFEHAGTGACLDHAVALTKRPGGRLSVVLQLPSTIEQGVSPTGFASLQGLKERFRMIEPAWLSAELSARGLLPEHSEQRALPAGKAFWLGIFQRARPAAANGE